VTFIPVLSHAADDSGWAGERGFVHERVDAWLKDLDVDGNGDVYACGPPPMIDALQPVLFMNGFETERIFFDRFTTSSAAVPGH
jgi:propane monooxygenase reductase subunit